MPRPTIGKPKPEPIAPAGEGGARPNVPKKRSPKVHTQTGTSTVSGGYTNVATGEKTAPKIERAGEDLGLFGGPGTAEQKQKELEKDYFGGESRVSQALPGLQEAISGPGAAEDYFAKYGAPQESAAAGIDPSLDEYYDFARQQQAADINDQLAARGGFGSSAGIGMLGQSLAKLGAEQASKRADFAMTRAELLDKSRLQGLEIGGGLAKTAQERAEGRAVTGFEASDLVDKSELDRIKEEFDQAQAAQTAAESRADTDWMHEYKMTGLVGDAVQADIDAAVAGKVDNLGISAAVLKAAIRQSNVAPELISELISSAPDIATLATELGVPEASLMTSETQENISATQRSEAKSAAQTAEAEEMGPRI